MILSAAHTGDGLVPQRPDVVRQHASAVLFFGVDAAAALTVCVVAEHEHAFFVGENGRVRATRVHSYDLIALYTLKEIDTENHKIMSKANNAFNY